ncbi:hypothetical protein KOEU_37670 [Komagataeibacter europaeus]|uniref:Putative zinc-ribbon domain-containing protein n=1 Tax=Komagataeibacter europaeus TaxID=33995 RepID=A0A0M0EBV7_KOMEU|nr:hypothetical protein KOEU_37670 [Komagataeibacter europaeus]
MKCPYCAESVKADAIKCKHCGSDILGVDTSEEKPQKEQSVSLNGGVVNQQYVVDFAARLKAKMPKAKASSIMITFMPEINEVKGNLPPSIQKKFELDLETELLRITKK